jgi:peptidoglycan/LPS O-acetylase OafA/YrhL
VFNNEYLSPDFGFAPVGRYKVTCWEGEYAVLGRWFVIFFYAFTVSVIASVLSYTFIEKPSIDAKRVFKNKYSN